MAEEQDPRALLRSLYAEMYGRRRIGAKTLDYYDGNQKLAFASEKFLEAFGGLFGAFADNWCATVVDAVEERLTVNGFRVDADGAADDEAKRIWEANELDIMSGIGHTDGLVQGSFNVCVWQAGDGDDANRAEITVESQATSIVRTHPKRLQLRTSGLRTWMDDDGYEHAELFLPDRVYLFRSKAKRTSSAIVDPMRVQWIEETNPDIADSLDASSSMDNPLGVVPIVPFINRPRLTRSRRAGFNAHSEIAAIMPIQDGVNKLLADMLIASEFAAYPQRNVTGWEVDEDDETGDIKEPEFRAGPGKTWWTENENARWGTFDVVSIEQYVKAIEMVVQHIASISRTPPHYLNASADRLSGESLKSAETGLVAKVRGKQKVLAAGWEEVMRLAGRIEDVDALARSEQMETIWADPETRTESEHVDAVAKKQALGVPEEQLWEEMGYTPEQIARFPAMRARSSIETAAAQAELRTVPALEVVDETTETPNPLTA